jgi:hypothetical protein
MNFTKFPIVVENKRNTPDMVKFTIESFGESQKVDWPEGLGKLKDIAIMIMQRRADQLGMTEDNLHFAHMWRLVEKETGIESYVVLARFYPTDRNDPVMVKMPFDLIKTPTGFKLTVEHFNLPV